MSTTTNKLLSPSLHCHCLLLRMFCHHQIHFHAHYNLKKVTATNHIAAAIRLKAKRLHRVKGNGREYFFYFNGCCFSINSSNNFKTNHFICCCHCSSIHETITTRTFSPPVIKLSTAKTTDFTFSRLLNAISCKSSSIVIWNLFVRIKLSRNFLFFSLTMFTGRVVRANALVIFSLW